MNPNYGQPNGVRPPPMMNNSQVPPQNFQNRSQMPMQPPNFSSNPQRPMMGQTSSPMQQGAGIPPHMMGQQQQPPSASPMQQGMGMGMGGMARPPMMGGPQQPPSASPMQQGMGMGMGGMARPPMMGGPQQPSPMQHPPPSPMQPGGGPPPMTTNRPPMMNQNQSPIPQPFSNFRPPMMGQPQPTQPMNRPPMMGGGQQSPMMGQPPPPPTQQQQQQQQQQQSTNASPQQLQSNMTPPQLATKPNQQPPLSTPPSQPQQPPSQYPPPPQGSIQPPPPQASQQQQQQHFPPQPLQQFQQSLQNNQLQQQQQQQPSPMAGGINRGQLPPQQTQGISSPTNGPPMMPRSPSIPGPPMANQLYSPQNLQQQQQQQLPQQLQRPLPPPQQQGYNQGPDMNRLAGNMANMSLNQQQPPPPQFGNQNDQYMHNNQRAKRVYSQSSAQYLPNQQQQQQQQRQMQNQQYNDPNLQHQKSQNQSKGTPNSQPRSRINPDQVPNPISVENVDQELYNKQPFLTSSTAMPPLVSTEVKVIDDGNCSPRFMRLTLYNIPSSEDILNSSMLSLGLIIQPLAEVPPYEEPIPLIDNGENGPIRCRRCKGYINPGVVFIDGGRRYVCNLCGCDNVVTDDYFCNLDINGKRCDIYRRPELTHGSVDYVATKDFMVREPVPITYIFIIDVSFSSIANGMLSKICEALKGMFSQEVSQFPPGAKVGFITYDRNVYFYNLKAELDQPQQLIVPDVEDIFIPISDGFLVDIVEAKKNILRLLDILPSMFENNHISDHAMGAAFQAATIALEKTGGKISVFASSIPSYGPGALKIRQDAKLLGTDKERSLYEPQDNWYKQIGQKCAVGGITVDTFLLPSEFIDVATVGVLATLTGGNIYFYPQFDQTKDSIRFINDIIFSLRRRFGYDGLLRVRASDGLRVEEYLGNFYMSNSTDLELSGLSSDTAFGVTIKYDSKLNENSNPTFQCALLYTTITGQRRIRIHTLSANTTPLLSDIFKFSELDTTLNYMVKSAVSQMFTQSLKNVREHLIEECVKVLTSYRKYCATSTAPGQLILPEPLKLLPLFLLCILKLGAFRTDLDTPDIRVNALRLLYNIDTSTLMSLLYPKIYDLNNLSEINPPDENGNIQLPTRIRASDKMIESDGIYLLENGIKMILWIGHSAPEEYIRDIFNVDSIEKVDSKMHLLPILNNPTSHKVRAVLAKIQSQSKRFLELQIVRNQIDSLMDVRFNNNLVEDKTNNYMSYVEFLCYIHKHIQNEISLS